MKMTIDEAAAGWFVNPGDVVFDIGSYLGETANIYLRRDAAVYGFEPLARSRRAMRSEVREDPRFHLMPFALSDRGGTAELVVPNRNAGAATLSDGFYRSSRRNVESGSSIETVEVRRLDDLDLPPARFWKIDAEGSELEVLKGAARVLVESPPAAIQVEIFLRNRRRYLATLNHIREIFPHLWAVGVSEAGRLTIYDVTTENVSSLRFHADLTRSGTPRYFASARPPREWVAGAAHDRSR